MAEISYAYIQVDGDGAVQNIAMFENYEDANRISRAVYGDQAFAAEYRYAVRPGGVDRFHDGRFWRVEEDGTETEAEYIPTEQDKISALQAENAQLKAESNDLTLAMAEMIGGGTGVESYPKKHYYPGAADPQTERGGSGGGREGLHQAYRGGAGRGIGRSRGRARRWVR